MKKQYVGIGVLVLVMIAAGWYFVSLNEPKAAPVVTPAPATTTPATTTDPATSSAEESRATQVTNAENVLPPTTDADTPTRTDTEIARNIAELGYTMNDVTVYRDEKFGFEFYYPKEATLQELIPITGRDQTHIRLCFNSDKYCEVSLSYGATLIEEAPYIYHDGNVDNVAEFGLPIIQNAVEIEDSVVTIGTVSLRYTFQKLAYDPDDTTYYGRKPKYRAIHNNKLYVFDTSYHSESRDTFSVEAKQFDDLFRATFRFIESAN
jgi:hypothetical protein